MIKISNVIISITLLLITMLILLFCTTDLSPFTIQNGYAHLVSDPDCRGDALLQIVPFFRDPNTGDVVTINGAWEGLRMVYRDTISHANDGCAFDGNGGPKTQTGRVTITLPNRDTVDVTPQSPGPGVDSIPCIGGFPSPTGGVVPNPNPPGDSVVCDPNQGSVNSREAPYQVHCNEASKEKGTLQLHAFSVFIGGRRHTFPNDPARPSPSQASLSTPCEIPHISITKISDISTAREGDRITYTIALSNTNRYASLGHLQVRDSLLGDLSSMFPDTLSPGHSETRVFFHIVQSSDPSSLVNSVFVHADPQGSSFPIDEQASATVNIIHRITTSLNRTSISLDQSVSDSATLNGHTTDAHGTVTYTLYSGECDQGEVVNTHTANVSNGLVPAFHSPAFRTAGHYYFQASYSGDSNNNPATSTCEPLTVNHNRPMVLTKIIDEDGNVVTSSSVLVRKSVHDTATLTDAYSPFHTTLTYHFYLKPDCTGIAVGDERVLVDTEGRIPDSTTVTPNSGFLSYSASYDGNINNAPAISQCENLRVLTPPEAARQLNSIIAHMSIFSTNVRDNLISKLDQVLNVMTDNIPFNLDACNPLDIFIQVVQDNLRNGLLTTQQADQILHSAQDIRNTALLCPT